MPWTVRPVHRLQGLPPERLIFPGTLLSKAHEHGLVAARFHEMDQISGSHGQGGLDLVRGAHGDSSAGLLSIFA